jgi:hypothetical protein
MRLSAALAGALLAGLTLGTAGPPAQDRPGRAEEVRRLIGQLDSNVYREREQASRRLLDMEKDALPALRRALASAGSLEFRRRVEHILGVFRERQRQRDRVAAIARGRRVAADLLVERLALRGKAATAEDWQAVGDLARAMTLWAGDKTGQPDRWFVPLDLDFWRWPLWALETWKDDSSRSFRKRIVVGADSRVDIASVSAIVCRRNLDIYLSAGPVVLLLNGDLKMGDPPGSITQTGAISQSVIFCDGDVRTKRIRHSVIVATGKVTSNKHLTKDSVIVAKARNPLPFLRLFETADVGVEIAAADRGVQVKRVRPGGPFDKAGVRAGDRITALGETPVASAEQFRRLLRGKVAARAEAAVTVRRGGKDLQFRIPLRD